MKKIIAVGFVLLLTACANPRSTTNQLELGMSKEQVRTIMGEPI